MYIYVYIYIYIYVYMYVYIYIYIYMYVCIYIYIYTKVPDNELKMVTEEFVNRNSSLSVYNGAYRTGVR